MMTNVPSSVWKRFPAKARSAVTALLFLLLSATQLQAQCSGGAITTFPYTEGFNVAGLPTCWTATVTSSTGTSNWTVGTSSTDITAPQSGTRFVYKSYSTSTAELVSAPFNLASLGSNPAKVTIWIYRHASTVAADVVRLYINNSTSSSGGTQLIEVFPLTSAAPSVASSGWYQYSAIVPASFNTSGDVYFIVRGETTAGFSSYDLGVDNFTVAQAPNCEVPTGLTAVPGTNNVQLSWVAPATTASSYSLYYSTTNTAPAANAAPSVAGINGTSYNLGGLTANTTYYTWVRSKCSATDSSAWTSATTFTTACNPTGLPVSEGFDASTLPSCWSRTLFSGTNNWTVGASSSDISAPQSGARFIYKAYNTSTADLISMPVSLTSLGTSEGRVSLWIYRHASAASGDAITVYINNSPVSNGATELLKINTLITASPSVTTGGWYNYTAPIPTSWNNGTVYFILKGETSAGFSSYDLGVDNFVVEKTPSCEKPTDAIVSNIAQTTALINLTPPTVGSTPVSYGIYYSTTNTAPTATTASMVSNITSLPYTLQNLAPGTTYYLWIRSKCSATDSSSWSTPSVKFTTLCNTVTTFTENFDAATTPNLPNCWGKLLRGATLSIYATVGTATGNAYSAANAVELYNSGSGASDDIMLVSPPLSNVGAGTHRLKFYARNSSATQDLEVGTLSDLSANGTFTLLTPVDIGTTYQEYIVDFSNYNGTDPYIAIRRLSTSTYTYVYIDNVTWEPIPTCDLPTALTASQATATTAQLGWTAPTNGSPTSYSVYYSTSNTAPAVLGAPTISGITSTTIALGNLTPNTTYYVWIRTKCSATDSSNWAGPISFATTCSATTAFNENFDGVTTPNLPSCWGKLLRGSTLSTFASVTTTTGSANASTYGVDLYNSSSGANDDIMLVSPPLSNTGAGNHRLRFFARNTTASQDLEIGTLNELSANATFTLLTPVDISTTYQEYIVDFSNYNGTDPFIAIRRLSTSTYTDVYIDNVVWEALPTCDAPTGVTFSNITTTGADVAWTPPSIGSPSSYSIYVGTTTTNPAATAAPTVSGVTGTTYTLSNLQPSTKYYVWVRSKCSATDSSGWSNIANFSTACGTIATPTATVESFATFPATCWTFAQGYIDQTMTTVTSSTSYWVQDDFANVTSPLNKSAKINIYGTLRKDWLITPSYDLGAGGNKKLDFDLALTTFADVTANNLDSDDKLAVFISTDNGTTWSSANILRQWSSNTPISNTGEHISIPLTGYTGVVKFAFYGESTASGADNDIFIDNVAVVLNPLPVTLKAFTGERRGNANQLSWSTATESNNKGFELQRSVDGTTYTSISFVNSKAENGNSNQTLNYAYTDEKIAATASYYYRLKQVDKDGKYNFSNAVFIKGAKATKLELVSVYPNPAKDQLNISIASPKADNVTFIVTDMTGKVVLQQRKAVANGDNLLQLNVQQLSQGSYLLKAICADGCETAVSKFMKN